MDMFYFGINKMLKESASNMLWDEGTTAQDIKIASAYNKTVKIV